MLLDFEKYAMKGNEFLNRLEINLGTADRPHAARILKSTFRVLRNHLTFEESLQLLSQLPIAIKGVYVDGWTKGQHKRIKTEDDFLVEILLEDGNMVWKDFNDKESVLESVRAVIHTMRQYVSSGEINQALATLPEKIQAIFESSSLEE
jgi:uncharacterized protein (DUF2267 family)